MTPRVLQAFQMLQVAPWAKPEEVKRAYLERARMLHPDVQPRANDQMALLNAARDVLVSG